jgi:hypothetical protein
MLLKFGLVGFSVRFLKKKHVFLTFGFILQVNFIKYEDGSLQINACSNRNLSVSIWVFTTA